MSTFPSFCSLVVCLCMFLQTLTLLVRITSLRLTSPASYYSYTADSFEEPVCRPH